MKHLTNLGIFGLAVGCCWAGLRADNSPKISVPQEGALNCQVTQASKPHAEHTDKVVWLKCEGGLTLELQAIQLGDQVTLKVLPGGTTDELWLQPYVAYPLNFRVVAKDAK